MTKKVLVETILVHLLEIMLVYLLLNNENLKKMMNLELDLLVVLFSLIILLQNHDVFFWRFFILLIFDA